MVRASLVLLAAAAAAAAATVSATPTTLVAQQRQQQQRQQTATPDTAAAVRALAELEAACRREASALWGASLCGPTILVDPATRTAIANRPDSAGVLTLLSSGSGGETSGVAYVGTLPQGVPLANTSSRWGGATWAMILLPLPDDPYSRLKLLAHESFHRLQPELGLAGRDPVSAHLDAREGRSLLRLELRALARALRTSGDSALPAVRDALLFRARRNRLYPGSDTLEAALERQEGLAEYTGARAALTALGVPESRAAVDVERAEASGRPFVRSFAYATGPALGLLLDRYAPAWRGRVKATPTTVAPARLLAEAVGFRAPPSATALAARADARARLYGGGAVAAEERRRERERRAREYAYRSRLVTGPLLVLRQQSLGVSFDPTALFPLGDAGTVYPTGSFVGPWGKLDVTSGGALIASDFTRVAVPAPTDTAARPLRGAGWTLSLEPGWEVRRDARGSWEVVRAAAGR